VKIGRSSSSSRIARSSTGGSGSAVRVTGGLAAVAVDRPVARRRDDPEGEEGGTPVSATTRRAIANASSKAVLSEVDVAEQPHQDGDTAAVVRDQRE
jgi:hypothetical protein